MPMDAIVIGAGPAGLAVSRQLSKRNITHKVLEKASGIGESWKRYYESLTLHTGKHCSSLPDMSFEKSVPLFPSRTDVIEYLEKYHSQFKLPVQFESHVRNIARLHPTGFVVRTDKEEIATRNVVVATGIFSNPRVPALENLSLFAGSVIHSSAYRNPIAFLGKKVLVVGIGNSGAEIAAELAANGVEVCVSARNGKAVIPLKLLGVPIQTLGIFRLDLTNTR
jgi:indole-3-pyruvate monooxygenase